MPNAFETCFCRCTCHSLFGITKMSVNLSYKGQIYTTLLGYNYCSSEFNSIHVCIPCQSVCLFEGCDRLRYSDVKDVIPNFGEVMTSDHHYF